MGAKATANTGHTNYSDLVFLCGFDEGTGTSVAELIQSATGTVGGTNAPTWGTIDPTYGNYLSWGENEDGDVDFGDNANWDGQTAFTVFVWYRGNSNAKNGSTGYFVQKAGSGDDGPQIYWLTNENVGAVLDLGASNFTQTISDGLDDGTTGAVASNWNAVGFTWDGTDFITRINTTKSAGASASGTMAATAHNLVVGNSTSASTNSIDGDIAIVAMWNAGLSDTDWNAIVSDPMSLFGSSEITSSGSPSSDESATAGTSERELPGSGTPASQVASTAGTSERVLTCSGALTTDPSSVSGSASLQLKVLLTAAEGRELRDEEGALVANLANISYEWYDKDTDTSGAPDNSGTFSTDASGEATIQIPGTTLTTGQFGLLVLEHPTDNTIRGIYRIPVT